MKGRVKQYFDIICPMEEGSGMLLSSVIIMVHMCGREGEKRGHWGLGKGPKNEHWARNCRGSQLHTKGHHSK
jgi:hypothetical protein